MLVEFGFALGADVVEKATGVAGRIVVCGIDDIGINYEVGFQKQIMGRRRHWKRESEIRLAKKLKKKKAPKKTAA